MRARSEILAIWAALKQLSENINDAMCVVLLRLMKTKISTWCFFLSTLTLHLTKLGKVIQAGCFDFAQMKASVELCTNKRSDAAAKSGVKANCAKFDSELRELGTQDGLTDSCVSSGNGVLEGCRKISKLIVPIQNNGDRSEKNNYSGMSLLNFPGRV